MGTIQEVMTPNPVTLATTATAVDAARAMRDNDVGAIVVVEGDSARGIVTDRDIAVRVVAEGRDPNQVQLGEFASANLVTVRPDASEEDAVRLMRENALRRIIVVDDQNRPVGIVSIGDLAIDLDSDSALAEVSAAPPNN